MGGRERERRKDILYLQLEQIRHQSMKVSSAPPPMTSSNTAPREDNDSRVLQLRTEVYTYNVCTLSLSLSLSLSRNSLHTVG